MATIRGSQIAPVMLCLLLFVWAGSNVGGAESRTSQVMTAEEHEVFRLCNERRMVAGFSPCKASGLLIVAARGHSKEMMDLGFFDHVSPTPGRTMPWDRVALTGAQTNRVAENLYEAEDYPLSTTPAQAVSTWMRSSGHRHNILGPANVNMGVGICLRGTKVVVTQLFSGEIQ